MLMMLIYEHVLGGIIHNIKKSIESLVVASKEVGLEVNADKTKYIIISRDKNAGRSHYIKMDNSSFERVEEFKYLETALTYQNSIQEEIKSTFNSGNACYFSVQSFMSFSFQSKNIEIKIYKIIFFPLCLNACESWSLTLREECRLRVYENKMLRRIFGPKRNDITGDWRKLHNEEINDLYSSPILFG
jgi:predicted RNA-binding protein YlxR (DUF448 family)